MLGSLSPEADTQWFGVSDFTNEEDLFSHVNFVMGTHTDSFLHVSVLGSIEAALPTCFQGTFGYLSSLIPKEEVAVFLTRLLPD